MTRHRGKRNLRWVCIVALTLIYTFATMVSKIFARRSSRSVKPQQGITLLVIGTFYNYGWFQSHLKPLLDSDIHKIIVVTDGVIAEYARLEYRCPPNWLNKLFSRAGAKFFTALYCTIKYRPNLVMGYHIFPSAVIALICARLSGAYAAFQLTGGPGEWQEGGWTMENPVLTGLRGPSLQVEKMAIHLLREFHWIIVRGSRAEAELRNVGFTGHISIITGSITPPRYVRTANDRDVDLVSVGRLEEIKRPHLFVETVISNIDIIELAIMVGDGDEREALESLIADGQINGTISLAGKVLDPEIYYERSRVFLLTSRSEGVSISLLEAMSHGCVPVCSDVGDLSDFVINGQTGFLVDAEDVEGFSKSVRTLLTDPNLLHKLSTEAQRFAIDNSSLHAISQRWNREIQLLFQINPSTG